MKMRRIAGLLLTAACAVSLLCPAAWAVNASSVDKSGGNVRLSYRLQMPAVEDSAKIGADVKAQVKTTARRTSNSVVEIGMNSRADAESQLGMKFVSSSTFDALPQGGGTDNVVVSFKPSQKITNTMYNQYRTDGAVSLTFAASTRWDGSDEAAVEESVTAPGALVCQGRLHRSQRSGLPDLQREGCCRQCDGPVHRVPARCHHLSAVCPEHRCHAAELPERLAGHPELSGIKFA